MADPRGLTTAKVRPNLPWIERFGTTPDGRVNGLGVAVRVAQAVLVVANPLTAAVMWGELLALSRTRVKGWWLSAPAGVLLVVALFAGWIARYNAPWKEILPAAVEGLRERNATVLTVLREHWAEWLWMQLPVALIAGTCVAGLVLSYRSRYYGAWREKSRPASTKTLTKALGEVDAGLPNPSAVRTADELRLRFGVDMHTAKPFDVAGIALRTHGIVDGPTGFGKSTTLRRIADQMLAQPTAEGVRVGAVVIDMKADAGMVTFLRQLADATGRRFHLITVEDETSDRWNPLAHGNAAQMRSKLIEIEANSEDGGFSEPHYKKLGERFLLIVCKVLVELAEQEAVDSFDGVRRPWRKDLPDMVRLMNIGKLAEQTDRLSPRTAREVATYLREVKETRDLAGDVYGLYNRYALVTSGPAGEIMSAERDGLDLLEAMSSGDIVLFSLDAMADAGTAQQLGNFALQEATYAFGRLARERFAENGNMTLTMIDEFSALGGNLLDNMYDRGRGAGAAVFLASQNIPADLAAVAPEFREKVITNANVVVLHQQRGENADLWARYIGTREVWKETIVFEGKNGLLGLQESASGTGSLREADEFQVHPNVLKNLRPGEAVITIGNPERRTGQVRIATPPARGVVNGTGVAGSPASSTTRGTGTAAPARPRPPADVKMANTARVKSQFRTTAAPDDETEMTPAPATTKTAPPPTPRPPTSSTTPADPLTDYDGDSSDAPVIEPDDD